MPASCKYYFGKVFAHLAAALAVSAASAEYSNLGAQLLGNSSLLIKTVVNIAVAIGLLFGLQMTAPGSLFKYPLFIAFAFWMGQALKPYVERLEDKGSIRRYDRARIL